MFESPSGQLLHPDEVTAITTGRHGNPFGVFGPHDSPRGRLVRTFLPGAQRVETVSRAGDLLGILEDRQSPGLFSGLVAGTDEYLLRIEWPETIQITEDPYAFGPQLGELDLHLINRGEHLNLADCLGAHPAQIGHVEGVRFAVWAPRAQRVAVIGDFNTWDNRRHPMRKHHEAGIWEIFVPRLQAGERYKFSILGADGNECPDKLDPVARHAARAGEAVSIVTGPLAHQWNDERWMEERAGRHGKDAPVSIYEVHLPSWKHFGVAKATWTNAAEKLVPYVTTLGFTHIELLPVMDHPFGGSWGYQPLSMFAPECSLGTPEEFAGFVDACHQAGLGVILDWVPAHFPDDPHGLAKFDGSDAYEYPDPFMARHPDWGTCIYDYGRREVRNFLTASALYWLRTFHIDGLRVDAVASMLYRDYSRPHDQWSPNVYGGRENFEAISLLQHINASVLRECPGAIMIAEESTSWPGVTKSTEDGGLGFTFKWNMGWMNDTLRYVHREAVHRRWHHDEITFGLMYAFAENFILPLSHDEVVHEKGSLIEKMPGDYWQKHAGLRCYLALMWSKPGKKLLFMGGEFGQFREWSHERELDWSLYNYPAHAGLALFTRNLNETYRAEPSLHTDCSHDNFQWLVVDDRDNSVFVYQRQAEGAAPVIAVINMTPVPRIGYRFGVERDGKWNEILNSDATYYGGSGVGNGGGVETTNVATHGHPHSLTLDIPPLAALFLRHEPY